MKEIKKIDGKKFTAANQLDVCDAIKKLIVSQPGYQRGNEMKITQAKNGGYRLYAMIDGKWMDASLEDMRRPAQYYIWDNGKRCPAFKRQVAGSIPLQASTAQERKLGIKYYIPAK